MDVHNYWDWRIAHFWNQSWKNLLATTCMHMHFGNPCKYSFYSKEYRTFHSGYNTINFFLLFLLIILYSYIYFIFSNKSAVKRKINVSTQTFDFTLIAAFISRRLEVKLKIFLNSRTISLFLPWLEFEDSRLTVIKLSSFLITWCSRQKEK